ncbi:M28 family metallopeptidase [Asticcacaulis sp.]|uniref:M28 family metallopeptidase n=1 Tax=Asticcacaulis sp. TaxID=1872648 RepID=UPI002C2A1C9C|nr:M28 family peptidase [Asticcacaulis sp.]HTM80443.1 M28 family peptidase [Asticcacaulis sp.]
MLKYRLVLAASLLALVSTSAMAETWTVKPEWVAAHEAFLASDALRGRKSASPDEAIAAAYVGAQFQSYGLKPAPGMGGYLQTAGVVTPKLTGHAALSVGDVKTSEGDGLTLLYTNGKPIAGNLVVVSSDDIANLPAGDILLINNSSKTPLAGWWRAARARGVKLLIVRDSDDSRALLKRFGGQTGTAPQLDSGQNGMGGARPDLISLSDAAFAQAVATNGQMITLDLGGATLERSVTTNAIGYLEGSDPAGGVILVTAHLDHLGVRLDGTIMHGANDDASGTVAVLEVAHALAAGKKPKRGVLFVAYGAEEIGGLGSTYFGEHPPIPLEQIVANLEFEMIGAQDPKMATGELMMTGFERSNLGEILKAKGAKITADPYPDQHFFERSDNYSLALKGIVAHTISGWAVTPTYHDKTDDIAHLDLPFMTQAIQSLIVPVEYLINSDFKPEWKPGGKPE